MYEQDEKCNDLLCTAQAYFCKRPRSRDWKTFLEWGNVKGLPPGTGKLFLAREQCKRSRSRERKTFQARGNVKDFAPGIGRLFRLGECKRYPSRERKTFPAWGNVKGLALGIGSLFWQGRMYIKGLAPGTRRLFPARWKCKRSCSRDWKNFPGKVEM
jgi:hypothetical protein